jgi:hypothetical protein
MSSLARRTCLRRTKAEFQRQVAETLSDFDRSAFRGDIALQLRLETTYKTPPQAHSIAKNLLDLLGRQGPTDKNWQKTRLYKDDSQIHALSVACAYGQTHPSIISWRGRMNPGPDTKRICEERLTTATMIQCLVFPKKIES